MSKLGYRRLLRARYSFLVRNEILALSAISLDRVLALPHPQREAAFVSMLQLGSRTGAMSSFDKLA